MSAIPLPAQGWMPIRVYWREDQPWLDWVHLGTQRFVEPFFDQTVRQCLNEPFNLVFQHQTPIAALEEWHRNWRAPDPTGFIFHMSRCGSTLVSQMLASQPQSIVLSEAPPIAAVLETKYRAVDVSEEQRLLWLQWLIGAMAHRRTAAEQHVFIKFDCWHTLDLPLIRRAFPRVPWIFLYREPVEVLMSQLKQRGSCLVPGIVSPSRFGIDPSAAACMLAEEYCARALAAICEAGFRHARQYDGLLVNYSELPRAVVSTILEYFRVACTSAQLAAMAEAAAYDAKTPSLYYTPDSAAKRQAATEAARAAAAAWLGPIYRELEAARARQDLTSQPRQ